MQAFEYSLAHYRPSLRSSVMKTRAWRWWHWLTAGIVVLLLVFMTVLVGLRSWSIARLEAVEAGLRTAHRPTRYVEHFAMAPTRDPIQFQAWLALETRWQATAASSMPVALWLQKGALSPTPPDVGAWLTTHAFLIDETATLLRHSGQLFGTWPDPSSFTATDIYGSIAMNAAAPKIDALRPYAFALAATASDLQDDRRLEDIDLLIARFAPNTQFDGMVLRMLVSIRDRTQLFRLLQRPPGSVTAAWTASSPVMLTMGRQALLGERLLGSATSAENALAATAFGSDWYTWTIGAADAAVLVTTLADLETRVSGLAAPITPMPSWAIISRISAPNLYETTHMYVEADAEERAARIAAELIQSWRAGTPPAIDLAALPESCRTRLIASPGAATLRYTRNSEGFVIDIDPAAVQPPGMCRVPKILVPRGPLTVGAGVAVQGAPTP